MTKHVTHRLLRQEEWHRLSAPFKRAFGHDTLPPAEVAICAVCEVDGQIEGFLFLQPLPHLEPGASFSPEVSLNNLKNILELEARELDLNVYYSYTSDSKFDPAMIAAGFEPVGVMWRKRLS